MSDVRSIVARLADRARARTEADVQADVRALLLTAPLGLADDNLVMLEVQVGARRRIDVEVGFTVIEVKKDLRRGGVLVDAEVQLADYVETRERELGQRYVGVLTDGADWRAYHVRDGKLVEVAAVTVGTSQPDADRLLAWLEGVLATTQGVRPTPAEIARRLGVESTSHALDRASLAALYVANRAHPSVVLKRQLWARLLTTALGTQFEDTDELFLNHTLLVVSAKVIAHAVLGVEFASVAPATLLGGGQFERAQIAGVVEADFFDWVLEVKGGDGFVRTTARRLARFDWTSVEHDVLKVLYESVIDADTRKRLGEYYTPDWLAEHIVATAVTSPTTERVLDPSCGSGTFLFHAVRRYLAACDTAGTAVGTSLAALSDRVLGMDLHPVAVALARVTYLLAIGRARLQHPSRGPVRIPVYLGDSLQWRQRIDILTKGDLVIPVDDRADLFALELRFPDRLLDDVAAFDGLVSELADAAARHKPGGAPAPLAATFRRRGVSANDELTVTQTFALMCRLHAEGRNHIWGYYVRNLARPLWLSRPQNRVDVLVGNPPWLAYRHMPQQMQEVFRGMCESRCLWKGAKVATHQDLSGLFVARAIQLYLKVGGRFAFVMPNAALDRVQFEGFRAGDFPDNDGQVGVEFAVPWDLRRLRPHFFPRAASVVLGRRGVAGAPVAMPAGAERWTGKLPSVNAAWREVEPHVDRCSGELHVAADVYASPYRTRFAQGATLVPRVLLMVDVRQSGPLGVAAGECAVRSSRSVSEKEPWRSLPALDGVVEAQFIRRVLLGESVLPHRALSPRACVVPCDHGDVLAGDSARIDLYPRLARWWREAERQWIAHRSSDRLSLVDQIDYRHKLRDQLGASGNRVVYGKSGMHIAAARVTDGTAIIDHSLYWAAAQSDAEAHYLCAVLNSAITTTRVRPLLSYGKDERHIDKFVWQLPIGQFDAHLPLHRELAELGHRAETEIAALGLDETRNFVALRRQVREFLGTSVVGGAIDARVERLLMGAG